MFPVINTHAPDGGSEALTVFNLGQEQGVSMGPLPATSPVGAVALLVVLADGGRLAVRQVM